MKKKCLKVILISMVLILLIIGSLITLRHEIIRNSLHLTLSRSHHTYLSMEIEDIDFHPFSSDLTLKNLSLHFDNLELDTAKNLQIKSVSFKEIYLKDISVWHLVVFRELQANILLVKNPLAQFNSEKTNNTPKIHPVDLSAIFSTQGESKSLHPIKIENLIIEGGHVDLEQFTNDTNSEWKFDYQITLRDFNTHEALFSDTSRFLFSKTADIALRNVIHNNPSGEEIRIDSLLLSSTTSGLSLYGMTFLAHGDNQHINAINGYIKQAEVDLLWPTNNDARAIVGFRAIKLNSGHLVVIEKDSAPQQKTNPTSLLLHQVKTLVIDTMQISDFDFVLKTINHDTIFSSDIRNIELQELYADSGFVTDPKKITLQHLNWNMGETHLHLSDKGLRTHFNSSTFTDHSGELKIINLSFNDSSDKKRLATQIEIDTLAFVGLFMSKMHADPPMPLHLEIVKPHLLLKQDASTESSTTGEHTIKMPDNLTIKTLNITNGTVIYEKTNQFESTANNINVSLINNNPTTASLISDLIMSDLHITTDKVQIKNQKNNQSYNWQHADITNNLATIQHIEIEDNKNTNLQIPQLEIPNPNLTNLLNQDHPNFGIITLYYAKFSGNIDLRESENKTHTDPVPFKEKTLLSFDGLRIVDGSVKATLLATTDTICLNSKIDLTTSGYTVTNKMDKNRISALDWAITLTDAHIAHRSGNVQAMEVNLVKADSSFTIKNLAIEEAGFKSNKFNINKLNFDELNINSLNYRQLILENQLEFGTLKVSHPTLSVDISSQPLKLETPKNEARQKTDLTRLPFAFREIQLEKMQLQIAHRDSSSVGLINIGEMDIAVSDFTGQSNTSNLANHLQLKVSDINYKNHLSQEKFQIDHLEFSPDYDQLIITGIAGDIQRTSEGKGQPEPMLNFKIDDLGISGLHLSKQWPTTLAIRKIAVNNPDLSIFRDQSNPPKQQSHKKIDSIKLPGMLQQLHIDTVMISNLIYNQTYRSHEHPKTSVSGLDISFNQIKIDSAGISAQNFSFIEEAAVEAGSYHIISTDSLYSTSLKRASYNFLTNTLTIDSLSVDPRYSDELFFIKARYQTDRLHLFGEKIVCQHLRTEKLIETGQIHFGSIDVFGLDARLYRDKHYPMDPKAFKKMPQAMLRETNRIFLIDSIKTHDAEIHYKEIVEKASHPGYIFFTQFNLTLYNITNDPIRLKTDSVARVVLNAKIMGQTDLQLFLFLELKSKNDAFWFTGHTGSIPFELLNPVTQNLVGIDMQGGEGRLLIPKITGDSSNTSGQVLFLYKKLRVGLYNREKATSTTGITRGMANILLNDLFIRSNNPVWLRKPKTGMVYFDRVDEKSFVFYVWKSVLSGMLSTFGVNSREQRNEKRVLMQNVQ